ncbi:hypothetical protein ABT297_01330 [Dactylosporangium sp. NPDC000555]|uniref:hypothetical protein n=1 Tax=Dactylosporangium sp. NPDC000555 TaxID=3154260 RepID=UPI00332EB24D
MDESAEKDGTPWRRVAWFVVWYVVVLLPALGLIALTAWVPAVPGALLLLAGLVVAGYGTVHIVRRFNRGPSDAGATPVGNPPDAVHGADRPDQRHEPSRTVRSSLRSLGHGVALLAVPAAITFAFGTLLERQDEVGIGPVANVAVWVLAIVDITLITVLAFTLLYRVLRFLAVVWWALRVARSRASGNQGAESDPPPGVRPGPSGAYWVGVVSVVLFGSLTAGLIAVLIDYGWESWQYHHAPPCSETVTSGCRSLETVRVVDLVKVRRNRLDEYQLTTSDGVRAWVATRPKQWRSLPTDGLMATMERYDGRVFAVSAAGATRLTTDNPDEQVPQFVPAVPASAGFIWYAAAFAGAAREALTGREAPKRSRRAERLRRIGLAVVIGGLITFLVPALHAGLSLHVVLTIEITATAVAFLLLAWHARRRESTAPSE